MSENNGGFNMKKRYKILLAIVLIVICAGAGAFYLLQPLKVQAEDPVRGSLAEKVTEQGHLVPGHSITINANMTGTVKTVPVKAGRKVQEGDTLLEIDTAVVKKELQNQIDSLKLQQSAVYSENKNAKAEISVRRTQLEQQLNAARQQYDSLFGDGGTADAQLSIARINYEQAVQSYENARDYYKDMPGNYTPGEGEVQALQSQMNAAEEQFIIAQNNSSDTTRAYFEETIASCEEQLKALGNSGTNTDNSSYAAARQLQITIDDLEEKMERGPVTAPDTGILWNLLSDEGGFVTENQPVAVMYDEEGMLIKVSLLAEDALALEEGDTAQCTLADGTSFEAAVDFISPVADDVVSTVGLTENRCTVELSAEKLPADIGAGYEVDVTFTFTAAEDVLSIPVGCLIPDGTGSAVYVIRKNKAVLVPVETGVQSAGRVEIRSGLEEGGTVITNPYDSKVKDGSRVTY